MGWGSCAPFSRWGNKWTGTKVYLTQSPSRHGPWPRQNIWAGSISQHLLFASSAAYAKSWDTYFPSLPNILQPLSGSLPQAPPQNKLFPAPCLCRNMCPPFCRAGTFPALKYLLITPPQKGLPKQPPWRSSSITISRSSCFLQGSYTMWEYFLASPLELFVNKLPFKQEDG